MDVAYFARIIRIYYIDMFKLNVILATDTEITLSSGVIRRYKCKCASGQSRLTCVAVYIIICVSA